MIRLKLQEHIKEKGLSIRELSRKTGYRFDSIRLFVKGETQLLSIEMLDRLCRVLDVQPGEIMEFVPDKEEAR